MRRHSPRITWRCLGVDLSWILDRCAYRSSNHGVIATSRTDTFPPTISLFPSYNPGGTAVRGRPRPGNRDHHVRRNPTPTALYTKHRSPGGARWLRYGQLEYDAFSRVIDWHEQYTFRATLSTYFVACGVFNPPTINTPEARKHRIEALEGLQILFGRWAGMIIH
ncbi:uncharacterized protein H6S33_006827 [Morchella sextelata]|uniref:uncharacterized protein n=1 Tax=Morchella sextelata TaxID=1174677 RepID=UPI001D0483C8|nr:uncharacterized protein H6S33_006827 [Morchella sextelata]KAH0604450.1 hypothetical protein H6S33_006827 [Morchella sextelata]